jgi:hypothetical protein
MWRQLPAELTLLVLRFRARLLAGHARRIQTAWRGYRARVLLGRFRMLRYLRDFREWNPSAPNFLRRARL